MTRNKNESHFIQRQRWCHTTIQVRRDFRRSLVHALTHSRANCDIRSGCLGFCLVDLEYHQAWSWQPSQAAWAAQPCNTSLVHISNFRISPFLLITNTAVVFMTDKHLLIYQKYVVLLICLCFTLNKSILHKLHEDTCIIFSIPISDPP